MVYRKVSKGQRRSFESAVQDFYDEYYGIDWVESVYDAGLELEREVIQQLLPTARYMERCLGTRWVESYNTRRPGPYNTRRHHLRQSILHWTAR